MDERIEQSGEEDRAEAPDPVTPLAGATEPANRVAPADGPRTDDERMPPETAAVPRAEADQAKLPDVSPSELAETSDPVPAARPDAIPMPTASVRVRVDDFHFPALLNGLDFLSSAVESLARLGGPAPRDLKYAVLHLYTAVEVLLKVRLEMHDPTLVWEKPGQYDEAKHRAGAFRSCGAEYAIKRLKKHELLKTDLDPKSEELVALEELRNRLTHFGWTDTTDAVRARTLPVLLQLMTFLRLDLLPQVADTNEAWRAEREMDKINIQTQHLAEFVAHRKAEIADKLRGHEAMTVPCRSCGQHAIVLPEGPAADLICHFCGKSYPGSGVDAAWEYIGEDPHTTIKDGGEDFAGCSACGERAVVSVHTAASPDTLSYLCFGCGTDHEGVCDYCQNAGYITYTGMCDECYDIRLSRF
ncbi:hypothetical protein [Streptomyces lateritius]|uniref:hypothetical protein n=1 Tax=Streptomyces lateritius TaxID=67313 RepID=UPI001675C900|nr:hypothetical protein [Streptomyces lateritius]GGU11149.1 hypothetical protein GCM10010272_65290 [Streptomyces lateritius]